VTKILTQSFSGVASTSLDNIFSSTYEYYRILVQLTANTSAGTYLNWRARVSGSDNTTAGNYMWTSYGTVNSGGGAGGGAGSGSSATMNRINYLDNSGFNYADFVIYNPFSSSIKTGFTSVAVNEGGGSTRMEYSAGNMMVTTSYTGLTLLPTAGNISGKVSVYGYSI
jgi:hypothetical protein